MRLFWKEAGADRIFTLSVIMLREGLDEINHYTRSSIACSRLACAVRWSRRWKSSRMVPSSIVSSTIGWFIPSHERTLYF
jgi:hypothetical protein